MIAGGPKADWIAVDWGTSHCRAWAMSARGERLAEAASDKGMGKVTPEAFEPALLDLINPWLHAAPAPVIACGMVGSRQGWVEAPYTPVPCRADALRLVRAPTTDPRLHVTVIGGVRQDSPADVMRGEETQIAGILATKPGFDGVICLPGTHTKWAQVSAGEIVSFRTFMTGELFELLSRQSVLRHSVGAGWNEAAFGAAVADMLSKPEALAQRLFGIRADGLLAGTAPDVATARLSGLLIGAELAAAKPYWLGQPVALLGAPRLVGAYATALTAQGAPIETFDAVPMTLAGLSAARSAAEETPR